MQAVELEAAQLVRKFHAAPPRQRAHVATTLVKFCYRQLQGRQWQPQEKEWQDVGGRAGVVAALAQAANSSNDALQGLAVYNLGRLVFNHHGNQSAAAAAGAVPHLMQLTKSNNASLQQQAVIALGGLVFNHHGNQCAAAAAGALPHFMQLTKSSNADLQQEAVAALGFLVSKHHDNQSAAAAARAVPHLMQLTNSRNTVLQQRAVGALGGLVYDHHDNQSAAAAAGAVPHLMQLTKSSNAALQGSAVEALGRLVINHHDNQTAAGAAGAVECMCNLLSSVNPSHHVPMILEAANTLNHLSSLADNARRAVSMGAVVWLLLLQTRYNVTNGHPSIDQVLAKLEQVSSAPPQMPSSEPAFTAAASAAPAPVPAPARRLAPGSRVRIEGLQSRPDMNGRTGVICGALQQASMLCSC
jgi:hypothetical protein